MAKTKTTQQQQQQEDQSLVGSMAGQDDTAEGPLRNMPRVPDMPRGSASVPGFVEINMQPNTGGNGGNGGGSSSSSSSTSTQSTGIPTIPAYHALGAARLNVQSTNPTGTKYEVHFNRQESS